MDGQVGLKTIYVKWEDPRSIDPWTPYEEVELMLEPVESFGILLKESDKYLAIANTIDPSEESACCVMIIPKCLVIYRYDGKFVMEGQNIVPMKKDK